MSVVTLHEVELARLSEDGTVAAVVDALDAGRGGWVCPINLDVLRQCSADSGVRDLVNSADLVVADGMPLIWASRIARDPLPERVAGSTLIHGLTAAIAREGRSVFLLGGNEGAAAAAARILQQDNPGLRVAGTLCPPFGFERDPAQLASIETAVRAARADVVFVGLGFPKQDRLIARMRTHVPDSWFVSCGISFSFVSGEVQRAPLWIQRLGLEWVHRMVQEPRRLAPRYLVDDPPFLLKLLFSAIAARLRRSPRRAD